MAPVRRAYDPPAMAVSRELCRRAIGRRRTFGRAADSRCPQDLWHRQRLSAQDV